MKQYKFDARYRQSVDRVLGSMGLFHIGTRRQVENGTLMYLDPRTNCLYALYESGYIRRFTPKQLAWGQAFQYNGKGYAMYQLNPVYNENRTYTSLDGKQHLYKVKARRLLSPIEQLGRITIAITNYRIHLLTRSSVSI